MLFILSGTRNILNLGRLRNQLVISCHSLAPSLGFKDFRLKDLPLKWTTLRRNKSLKKLKKIFSHWLINYFHPKSWSTLTWERSRGRRKSKKFWRKNSKVSWEKCQKQCSWVLREFMSSRSQASYLFPNRRRKVQRRWWWTNSPEPIVSSNRTTTMSSKSPQAPNVIKDSEWYHYEKSFLFPYYTNIQYQFIK